MLNKLTGLLFAFYTLAFAQEQYIHHDIKVKLFPDQNRLEASDAITLPDDSLDSFLIHQGLQITTMDERVALTKVASGVTAKDVGMDQDNEETGSGVLLDRYKIVKRKGIAAPLTITLKYQGKIFHPIKQLGEEYARGFSISAGIIDIQGVYLAGASYWVPYFSDQFLTFNLEATVPADWDVVSQGDRARHEKLDLMTRVRWESPEPMEEVFLIAAPFFEFSATAGKVQAMAFLRSHDPALANKYLETTTQYLEMYRQLIGPFPFTKFALVENFWETGYGMPSFTLLGPKVIRFPFILHSSYPHELLHNWWGNSVYVDFSGGNWCEGLTAYLADHLIKEQRGQGAEYRQSALQRFTDYVNKENDFPLTGFRSRYDAASEAIGYGKSMMMWEMLRNELGDDAFKKTFITFNKNFAFKRASFDDIRKTAEEVSGKQLRAFFDQWVTRTGAPVLQIDRAGEEEQTAGYQLSFTLSQAQDEPAFLLNIPVRVRFADGMETYAVQMSQKQQNFSLTLDKKPYEISIDPDFNLFRKLHYQEIPPALSKIFGAEKILIILPAKGDDELHESYRLLAEKWSRDGSKDIQIKTDSEIETLPADRAVWIFGLQNRFLNVVSEGLAGQEALISTDEIKLGKSSLSTGEHAFAITVRHPGDVNAVAALLTIHDPAAMEGLARKLPHYGKYSYLAFEGDEPTNVAKGQWAVVGSPLTRVLADLPIGVELKSPSPRQALARLAPVFSEQKLKDHVIYLADTKREGRAPGSDGSRQAAEYIAERFEDFGLHPFVGNNYFQEWQDVVDAKGKQGTLRNVIGILPGRKAEYAGQSVIVSAHYDHLGHGWPDVHKGDEGKVHPGADDNASGVAVMLELARMMAKVKPDRTIIFIAFDGEESGLRGSKYYLEHIRGYPADKIMGVINLDTVGRLFKQKVLVLGSASAREWRFIFMGCSYVTGVESEMVTQELSSSDQATFIAAEIPAVQIFSGPHPDYHRPTDTVARLDIPGMVRVAAFTKEAVAHLAERDKPMNFSGAGSASKPASDKPAGERRATTGSMPDFTYKGVGVRLQEMPDDSPAAKAGLQPGDIILEMDGLKMADLRAYSNALKSHQPGDEVEISYEREGKVYKTRLILGER